MLSKYFNSINNGDCIIYYVPLYLIEIDLNFNQGSITDYIAIPDFIEDVQDYIKQNIRQLMQEWR